MLKQEWDNSQVQSRKGEMAPTVDELIARYELSNRAEGKSEKTIRWYDDMLRSYLRYEEAEHPCPDLSSFNIDTVRGYVLYLRHRQRFSGHPYIPKQEKLLSPRTIQGHCRALKAFSSWLYAEGYTKENRIKNLKIPKAPATIVEPLSPEETKVVIAGIDESTPTGIRNKTILLVMLDTGLRASEAADIRLGNLNLDDGYLKVMGKGAKERIVPIGKVVRRALWRYIDQARARPADVDCDNLFLSTTGHSITVNTIKLMFSRLAKVSDASRLHAHLCRHTFAINYLLNGGDIFSLQAILGHATLEMVRHYLHFTSSQIAAQHHKYSPMDRLHGEQAKDKAKDSVASPALI